MSAAREKDDEDLDPSTIVHDPSAHATVFNARAYLQDFYSKPDAEGAMHLVLFMIPGLAYLIGNANHGKNTNMLDFGCGPTIHMAAAFRTTFQNIYMADFAEQNRIELCKWWGNEKEQFDWTQVLDWLRVIESVDFDTDLMAVQTRERIQGVLACDALQQPSITGVHKALGPIPDVYDLVCSTFCLEYATTNVEDYTRAVTNMCTLVAPGGYVLLAGYSLTGVLGEQTYSTNHTYYRCHRLSKDHVTNALAQSGFTIRDDNSQPRTFKYIERDQVFVLLSQKLPATKN